MSFNFTVTSTKTPEEAIAALEETLLEDGFSVLWSFSVKDKLDEKGLGLDEPFQILEVCNAKIAKQVLEFSKLAGYFLPCKLVVYAEDGVTHIGMPKPTTLMDFVDDSQVRQVANDVEQSLMKCMEKAK
ncbi:DUF302 domain-containing protein [Bacillus shivajii]|uniref:DUF302 domain-containing protein n=1 Tax=Bacillus shivajii TaxID=1983719 RepID=UPI001CFC0E9B|nr:DUF302 domain-containing protein [Bacillus shivajii]UCZ54145.1 DUF302 domain-containing protein [Bacillus shivajii]